MATHTRALMRKWARYGACDDCAAAPGDPCLRKIPPHQRQHYGRAEILMNAHKGRSRSEKRCGDTDGHGLRIGSTFACFLVPDHGDTPHRDWHGRTWTHRLKGAAV